MTETLKKLPIGIQSFENIRKGDYLYVDKTKYIYDIVVERGLKYVFLSRPRRFGKSLLIDTLAKYFEGRKDLLEGLYLGEMEKEWAVHPVIRLDMSECKRDNVEELKSQISSLLVPYETKYLGKSFDGGDLGGRLKQVILSAEQATGMKVALLIDEYDAPLMHVLGKDGIFNQVRSMLRTLYGPIKYCDAHLCFGMITGITKFSQLSIFSEINNLYNISMLEDFTGICGITEEELDTQMGAYMERMAEAMGKSKEWVKEELIKMYDGYRFGESGEKVLNPFSLISAFTENKMRDHWFESATPSWLPIILENKEFDLKNLEGNGCTLMDFNVPAESMKCTWPLLYHTGYVTIKNYDPEVEEYTLGFPNSEVRNGMLRCLVPYYIEKEGTTLLINKLRKNLEDGDMHEALRKLRSLFASMPSLITSKTEKHFQAMFYLVFRLLTNTKTESEVQTAKGRADAVVKTREYIYVIEFKLDGSADKALEQIEKKGYAVPYETDGRKIVKIGANFSSESRTLTEWIVDYGEREDRWNEGMGEDWDDEEDDDD